jgi:probable F420-dependent oxidoreductase
MKIDTILHTKRLGEVGELAARAERAGHHAVWVTEEGTDPLLHAYAASLATEHCRTGTAITVAFARSPMTVAQTAWQLSEASGGRFVLGLGSQVKAHVERRYSMPWVKPVGQMRDYLTALSAIWSSWRTGERLRHEGEYYTHTLMAPFWNPEPHEHHIPVWLAAVGPMMVELAGELCDGVLLHPFSNPAYDDTVIRPALERGLARSGRTLADIEVSRPLFMVMGDDDQAIEQRRRGAARQLGFYASTRAYLPVLEAVGLGDIQPRLAELARAQEWEQMAGLLDQEALEHFAVIGRPEQMPELTRKHLSGFITRTSAYSGWPVDDPDRLTGILAGFDREQSR